MMHEMEMGVLAILGLCVAGGVLGAWIFQKLRVPQVVGYIVIGVLLGDTGFGLLHGSDIVALRPFNNFALGLIGFLVGANLAEVSLRNTENNSPPFYWAKDSPPFFSLALLRS